MRFTVLGTDAERRDGLKALLRQIHRQARFGEAHDWRGLDRVLRRQKTDLLVIDWEDSMSSAEAAELLALHPGTRIAMLCDDLAPHDVRELMHAGVRGIIWRHMEPRLIVRAFEMVMLGGHYVPPGVLKLDYPPRPVTRRTITPKRKPTRPAVPQPERKPMTTGLSPRQEQIIRCVHMGSTNKQIARTLGISEGTVKIHLASIFQQLGAPNRAAAVALYNGWMSANLEVLRSIREQRTKPALGEPNPVPLRAATARKCQYPLPSDDNDANQPLAAEPDTPFGDTPSTPDGKEPESGE